MIYLDNAATTKPKKEVIDLMMQYLTDKWQNPSSLYSSSKNIKKDIEKSRKTVAGFLNAEPEEIIFTSGGSESNCTVIQGFINYWKSKGQKTTIITTVIEHKSIIECVDNVAESLHYISVNEEGFVDCDILEAVLKNINKNNKILVSVQFANNEIGTIQDIKKISELVHKYNGVFHTDAVQAFGHILINVKKLGIDMLSASGHKIGTPKGIGILYKKKDINIKPIIYGSQESGLRGGTENIPYIIAFGMATVIAGRTMNKNESRIKELRDYFIMQLRKEFNCFINGSLISRLNNNISVTFVNQNITNESLLYLMDINNIYLSSGSACNSYSVKPSHVLQAIGLIDKWIRKTIRISIDETLTKEEIDYVIFELKRNIKLISEGYNDL